MARSPRTRWAKQEVALADLVVQARELRRQGLTYEAIGLAQGCGRRTAERRVKRGLAKVLDESAEETRKLELARLDAAHERHERSIQRLEALIARRSKRTSFGADELLVKAETALAKVLAAQTNTGESRRKLLGLDAPQQHEHSGALSVGPTILIPAERPDDAASAGLAPEPGPPN